MKLSKLTLILIAATCVLLSATSTSTASSSGLKVLVTGNESDVVAGLVTAIQSENGVATVTSFDTSTGTPTPAQLAAADIVVSIGDSSYSDPVTYGNELADYVDDGGVVLQAAYDNWNSSGASPTGRFASGGYAPLSLGPNDNETTQLGTVLTPKNPIVQNLGTFPTDDNTTTPLASGATLLAKWADGRNAIAVKGRVVATSASADPSDSLPGLARLAVNTGQHFTFVPNTKITKSTIGTSSASFMFEVIGQTNRGFRCELKGPGLKAKFTSCHVHKKYANLKPGKYTFEVAAVGLGGTDPTPAKKSFTLTG